MSFAPRAVPPSSGARAPVLLRRLRSVALHLLALAALGSVVLTGLVVLVPGMGLDGLAFRALTFPLTLLGAAAAALLIAAVARWMNEPLAAALWFASSTLAAGLVLWPSTRLVAFAWSHDVRLSLRAYVADARKPNYGQPVRERSRVYHVTEAGVPLELDVWPTVRDGGPRPAIVIVHGGGWHGGNRGEVPLWNRWFNELGYHVFDVDYRLDPPALHRKGLGDVQCALGWVVRHAEDYGVDPTRVALFGRSAGAHLALLAAFTREDPTLPASCAVPAVDPRAIVNLYGPTDLTALYAGGSSYTRAALTSYLGGPPSALPERYTAFSPVTRVGTRLIPILTIFGDSDRVVPAAQADLLSRALSGSGVPYETYVLPYAEHAFDLNWGGLATQIARTQVERFLARYLRPAPASTGPNRSPSP